MKQKILQWLGIILLIQIGLLHFFTAQRLYEEASYLGYLFMANLLAALISAYLVSNQKLAGWLLGLFLAAGSLAGFIASRTVGLPGIPVEQRLDGYGMTAAVVESVFLLLLLLRPWRAAPVPKVGDLPEPAQRASLRFVYPIFALLVIGLVSFSAFTWDSRLNEIPLHEHVGTLSQVCSTPFTSLAELRDKYGIEISLVAITQMGGVVDVRLKVIDPIKAHDLLINQAAILVEQQSLILAPHLHTHYKLKPDKLFFMFFSSERGTVHPGSNISLVFGRTRIEPVVVQ